MKYIISILFALFVSTVFSQRLIPSRQIIKGPPGYILTYDNDSLLQITPVGAFTDTDKFLQALQWDNATDTLTAYIYNKMGALVDSVQVLIDGFYTSTDFDTDFSGKTTTDLTEGTNLYFSDERVDDRVNALLVPGANIEGSYNDPGNSYTLSVPVTFRNDSLIFGDSAFVLNSGPGGIFDSANDGGTVTATAGDYNINLASSLVFQESNTDLVPSLEIEQLSTGDAGLQFSIPGHSYAIGIDNSDGDKFKISYAAAEGTAVLGTNDRLTITGAILRVGAGGGYGLEGAVNTLLQPDSYGFDLYGNLAPPNNQAYFATYGRTSTPTSGTTYGFDLGGLTLGSTGLGFGAGAGSANFQPLAINYSINNSGAQSGTATGIFLNATETALNSMGHNLIDLQVGGTSRFTVKNDGQLQASQYPGSFTGTVAKLLAVDASGNVIVTDEGGADTDIDSISIVNDSLYIGEGLTILRQDLSQLTAYAASSHVHAAADITSGTFADALIAQSNVTQHQAALSITESQISDFGSYVPTTRTLTAGAGISGGGDLSANRTFDLDWSGTELIEGTTFDVNDRFALYDATATGMRYISHANLITELQADLNHDNFTGFVANEHIDHTAVTLTAGAGLSGGGDISTNRTFTLDLANVNGWTAQQYFPIQTLTDQATITWDGNTQQVSKVTLGGNRTLANMTNVQPGAIYTLYFIQSTGGHTITFGTNYLFSGGDPTLSTGAGDIDKMVCGAISATQLSCDCAFNYE